MADNDDKKRYILEKNPEEAERLALAQEIIVDYMEKPVWAPIDLSKPGLRILESATASGAWLQDLEKSLPSESNNTYIGTDVTPIFFPEKYSSAITLSIQNIKEPWPEEWQDSFDLIHQRAALPAVGNKGSPQVISDFIGLVKPGGWIQFVEADHSIVEGDADRAFFQLLEEVFAAMDSNTDIAPRIEGWFRDAGLENVGCKVFDVPIGVKNPKEEIQAKSARFYGLGGKGVAQVAKNLPVSFTPEALESLSSDLEEEMSSKGGVLRLYCVWGQKPSV